MHGQGLHRLYFEAVFCLVPLHLSVDAKGAEGLLAPVFGGSLSEVELVTCLWWLPSALT